MTNEETLQRLRRYEEALEAQREEDDEFFADCEKAARINRGQGAE